MARIRPVSLVLCVAIAASARAGEASNFNIVKPSTTGIPGLEVRVMTFDPEGNLWVGARWPFWFESGIAMLSADQLAYDPLPGGGFDTGVWQVWSNVHDPVPSAYINAIRFAADGIIWIGSEGGLTRFDRSAEDPLEMWKTYNASNSPMVHDDVRSLAIDSQGHLWFTNTDVNHSNGPLFEFDPATETWTQYDVGEEIQGSWEPPWRSLNAVMIGPDDRVYVTHDVLSGFAEYDGQNWVIHDGGAQFGAMLRDLDGNIWFTTGGAGLWKWNGSSYESFGPIGGTVTITGLGLGLDGTVYVSTWYGGIYKMINDTPVFFVNADNIPRSVIQRPDGDIWINNYGGNGTSGTVRHYTADGQLLERMNTWNTGLPDYFVDRIQTDNSGNMWFATGEAGLSRMEGNNGAVPTRWRNWGDHNDNAEPYPWAGNEPMGAMFEDAAGDIWMGGNGVGRWDPETGTFLDFWNWQNSNLGVMYCAGFAQTADGTIWMGEPYVGLWHLDEELEDWILHTWAPPGWTANDVVDLTTDRTGTLWVLTYVQLHRLNSDGTWSTWDSENSPMSLGSLFDIEPDPDAGVWLGTGNGLLYFDGETWRVIDQAQAGWPAENVSGVSIRASDGAIGVSTQQGNTWPYTGGVSLSTDDGETWTHWTPDNSPLTHWQVVTVKFDPNGHLWASPMSEGVVQILVGDTGTPGDLDGDGDVDQSDLGILLADFGCNTGNCPGDTDGDGDTDQSDLGILLSNFGR